MTQMEPFGFVLRYRKSCGVVFFSLAFFLAVMFENKTTVWPSCARKSLLLLPRELEDKAYVAS